MNGLCIVVIKENVYKLQEEEELYEEDIKQIF